MRYGIYRNKCPTYSQYASHNLKQEKISVSLLGDKWIAMKTLADEKPTDAEAPPPGSRQALLRGERVRR
jgi:hypothetical protein